MPSEQNVQKAAQAWCQPTTSGKVMDPELATVFAEMLDEAGVEKQTYQEIHRQTFVDGAAIQLMPSCVQMTMTQAPSLAGAGPKVNVNIGQAAVMAYQCALAMWQIRSSMLASEPNPTPPASPKTPLQ